MFITSFMLSPWKASVLRKLINRIGENNLKMVLTRFCLCQCEFFVRNRDVYMHTCLPHIVSQSETCAVSRVNPLLRSLLLFQITEEDYFCAQVNTYARACNCIAQTQQSSYFFLFFNPPNVDPAVASSEILQPSILESVFS